MRKRLLHILLCAGLLAAAALTAFTLPASAELRTVLVKLPSGEVVEITVDVPPGTPNEAIGNFVKLPGVIVPPGTPVTPPATTPTPAPTPAPKTPSEPAPKPGTGTEQPKGGDKEKVKPGPKRRKADADEDEAKPKPRVERRKKRSRRERLRNGDGSPARSNPGFVDALPGPSFRSGVPNFVIRKFRVPIFLLPIYQAAGIQYGVRWEVLAAINEIETDYGRNLNVSSAGALGWMQFIPSSWRAYGVDANKDGRKDPYNPVDAIFAAGRYLKAAGYDKDVRRAIFAYNHADWYVDSVLLRARLIAGVPADLVGSLTGLTEGRFPVAARARYADDLQEAEATKRVKAGQNAANLVESQDDRRQIEIYTQNGAPAVAVNDGQIKTIGQNPRLGKYITLQDPYGNRYTYAGLKTTATHYPVPRDDASDPKLSAKALKANADGDEAQPTAPASAGRQPDVDDSDSAPRTDRNGDADKPEASIPVKDRLFAHPNAPGAREQGGLEQMLDAKARKEGGWESYGALFAKPFGTDADPDKVRLRRLKVGSRVIGGTVLGRVGVPESGKGAHLDFSVRPAGRGAPRIDPKPILDGWKLLEATAVYRASGKNVLYGDDGADGFSIGQILLLPKPLLEKRVLSDERIELYDCGRDDVRSGQVDRRVLATLAYLAESGLRPTVTSLKCGHGYYTASGNVSHHSSGNAVDIAKINGVPILGHQDPGGITEQSVKSLLRLQGTVAPDQIISLLEMGGQTIAMADHADHIHVGFRPLFGDNKKLGKQALAVLKPGQWSNLINQLRKIDNPTVPTKPSKYAIPVKKNRRSSDAHQGE